MNSMEYTKGRIAFLGGWFNRGREGSLAAKEMAGGRASIPPTIERAMEDIFVSNAARLECGIRFACSTDKEFNEKQLYIVSNRIILSEDKKKKKSTLFTRWVG